MRFVSVIKMRWCVTLLGIGACVAIVGVVLLSMTGQEKVEYAMKWSYGCTNPEGIRDIWAEIHPVTLRISRLYRDLDRDGTVDELIGFQAGIPWVCWRDFDGDGVLETTITLNVTEAQTEVEVTPHGPGPFRAEELNWRAKDYLGEVMLQEVASSSEGR